MNWKNPDSLNLAAESLRLLIEDTRAPDTQPRDNTRALTETLLSGLLGNPRQDSSGSRENVPAEAPTAAHPVWPEQRLAGLLPSGWNFGLESLLGPIYQVVKTLTRDDPSAQALPVRIPNPLGSPAATRMGLTGEGTLAAADYAENGLPRPTQPAMQPQIVVQVQAMDSSSFLDRSGDIAAALRRALLETPALQDEVVD